MRAWTRFTLVTVAADLLTLAAAGVVASVAVFGTPIPWEAPLQPNQNIRPLLELMVIAVGLGSYWTVRAIGRHLPRPSYARPVVNAAFSLALVAVGISFGRLYFSRQFIGYTLGVWLLGALVHRALRRRKPWSEQMILITDEKQLAHDLASAPHAEVLDVLDPAGEPPDQPLPAGVTLVTDLRAVLSDGMAGYVSSSVLAGSEVSPLTQVYEDHTGRLAVVHLAHGWEISEPLERRAPYAPVKRLLETLLVVVTAPLWVPLGVLIGLMIRLGSSGPAVFRQQRAGLHGAPFTVYKFRTMVNGADDGGPRFTAVDDTRITKVGRFLRSSRLDEIPQLWNVLKGDMALVGPRAEQVPFVKEFERHIPFYRYRHLVRPGITGWAQVNSGYADDLEDTIEKLTYDLYYVRHMSPGIDLTILWHSLWTMITGKGAQ